MDYKDFFSFTKQERNGIITFFIVSIMILLIFRLWPLQKTDPPMAIKDYYIDSLRLLSQSEPTENSLNDLWENSDKKTVITSKFTFDPNNISYDSLLLLGFSKYAAKSLTNYVSKGGVIYSKEKFKEIYGIDPKLVDELEGYASYPVKSNNKSFTTADFEKSVPKVAEKPMEAVELNRADSTSLISVKGIGPATAFKIMQMKRRTGGFLSAAQLVELKVVNDSMFQKIKDGISVNPDFIKKININTADYKTFVTHPYITSETANAILKYRKQHGNFTDPKHISRIRSLKEETGMKILPYLSIAD